MRVEWSISGNMSTLTGRARLGAAGYAIGCGKKAEMARLHRV